MLELELLQPLSFGLRIGPVSSRHDGGVDPGKRPLISFHEFTNDYSIVEARASRFPGCNWGWLPDDGYCVLDIDPRHGGDVELKRLESIFGTLPETPTVLTGGGGRHLIFRVPPELSFKKDINGNAGLTLVCGRKAQFVMPPSIHPSGKAYTWAKTFNACEPPALPEWLLALATSSSSSADSLGGVVVVASTPSPSPSPSITTTTTTTLTSSASRTATFPTIVFVGEGETLATAKGVGDGERRKTLLRLIGAEFARGRDADEIESEAESFAMRCSPALTEWRKHYEGVRRKESTTNPTLTMELRNAVEEEEEVGDAFPPDAKIDPSPTSSSSSTSSAATNRQPSPTSSSSSSTDNYNGGLVVDVQPTSSSSSMTFPDSLPPTLRQLYRESEPNVEGEAIACVYAVALAYGSAVGRNAYVSVGGTKHYPSEFAVVVGESGVGKSEPWTLASSIMERVDPEWHANAIGYGFGSGEGLVERIRDASGDDTGAEDKRLHVILNEFGTLLTRGRREGNTLSQTLTDAYDGRTLQVMNRKSNALKASSYSLSVWGNVTGEELRKRLRDSLEIVNGFANRFLWLSQTRTKYLPRGGDFRFAESVAMRLRESLAMAKTAGEVVFSEDAAKAWDAYYVSLCESQASSPVLSRARVHALRLTLLMALIDGVNVIEERHVFAGLSLWRHTEACAMAIFGNEDDNATLSVAILSTLPVDGSLVARYKINEVCKRYGNADAVAKALSDLASVNRVRCVIEPTSGRSAEKWARVAGDGVSDNNQPHPTVIPTMTWGGGEEEEEEEVSVISSGEEEEEEVGEATTPATSSSTPTDTKIVDEVGLVVDDNRELTEAEWERAWAGMTNEQRYPDSVEGFCRLLRLVPSQPSTWAEEYFRSIRMIGP
ncbi:hypothetical protein BH11PLA2_BH11PLA2_29280 [soil metagenome]